MSDADHPLQRIAIPATAPESVHSKHGGGPVNPHRVVHAQGPQLGPKTAGVTKGAVRQKHPQRNAILDGATDHQKGQLRLGAEGHVLGDSYLFSPLRIISPTLGQVQLEVDGRMLAPGSRRSGSRQADSWPPCRPTPCTAVAPRPSESPA